MVVINVVAMNGMKTINHETTPKPREQSIFNSIVNIIITMNFINAVL